MSENGGYRPEADISQCIERKYVKFIHWFSLAALVVGVALLFVGLTTAGCVILAIAPVIEVIHAAVTGKQTNSSTR